ncbi:MAG: hypothetical protein ACRCYX_06455 [Dermatophilaceae bacterium]
MTRARWIVVTISLLLVVGCERPGLQQNANREAAKFADRSLFRQVTEAATAAPADDRLAAVRQRLQTPDEAFLDRAADWAWIVGESAADEVPVTVYYNWENTSFSAEQAWGVACRVYRVGATVTVRAVECPEGTEPSPGAQDGLVGWYYR